MTERKSGDLTLANILGEGGLISRRLDSYEPREEQLQMAQAVARAIEDQRHLVVGGDADGGRVFAARRRGSVG